jgi:hypothetical protein
MGKYTEAELLKIRETAISNENLIKTGNEFACFNCFTRFNATEINDWISNGTSMNAVCPRCLIDSVIPADEGKAPDDLLAALQKKFFLD